MATPSFLFTARCFTHYARRHSKLRIIILSAGLLFFLATLVKAQSPPQQYVFGSTTTSANTSAVAAFAKNSQTGALSSVTGSPFNERMEGGLVAIDGLGKFLFVLNTVSNNISMFQVDSSTGALLEVPHSPFAAVPTINPSQAPATPLRLATEKSGQFLFVGYRSGNTSSNGAVQVFAIDPTNLRLIQAQSIDIPSSPIGLSTDPKSLHLYVGLGPNPSTGMQNAGTQVYSIDSLTGDLALLGSAGGGNETGRAIAVDAQGRFFFDGWGFSDGFLDSGLISPADGTAQVSSTISLGASNFPNALLGESSGKFLYVSESGGVFVYSIDQKTGALTLLPGGPVPLAFSAGTAVADPMGPYIYALTNSLVQAFQVDPLSGALASIASASTGGQGTLGIAISGQPVQASSGPVAVLFPASLDFGASTVGQSSITRIVSLVNTGNQSLSVNSISLTGTNAADFRATPAASCQPPALLLANANCPISLVFTPSAIGLRQTSLTAQDNAPGSPQSIMVSGTGVSANSAVTLMPGSITFPLITQGTTGTPLNINVKSSGTANLNIFSVALGGADPSEFILSNSCAGSIAVNASCIASVTFSPLGAGQRTASVTISDDAPNSPQTVELLGMAAPAFTITPATGGSFSATVTASQTAQFNLQVTPGTGFAGVVNFACAGAPTAAACKAPPSVQLGGGNSSVFSVMVTTTGSGASVPISLPMRIPPYALPFLIPLALICLLTLLLRKTRMVRGFAGETTRLALSGAFATTLLLAVLLSAGCGGGGSAPSSASIDPPVQPAPPQGVVTPSGTFTLTLSLTASNASGKQLATPQPVQLTLTVK
jgi:6-phosphogluconolactonase (cycloisomerase 2 family)